MALPFGATTVFDTFPPAVFNGIIFPVESSTISGGMRDKVHEYPHTPGGDPEKLARSLYQFRVVTKFDARFDAYPNLYPTGMNQLLGMWERGVTAPDFRLPQMSKKVPAYAVSWTREMSNRVRSGETVTFTLREDTSADFVFDALAPKVAGLSSNISALNASILSQVSFQLKNLPTSDQGLFSGLTSAVNSLLAFKDQANLFDQRVQATVAQVSNLCSQLDVRPWAQQPLAFPVINALHDLWASAIAMQKDIAQQGATMQKWIVPTTMSVATLAANIYSGDSSRAEDLLSLNNFPDPLQIPAGFRVSYYALT